MWMTKGKDTNKQMKDNLTKDTKDRGLIECSNLSFSYESGAQILKDITFSTKEGEAVGIVGANGAGKSTLLRILVGLETAYKGEVLIDKITVKRDTLAAVRAHAGYLFQDSDNQLFTQSVYQDVAFAPRNYGLEEKEVDKRVMEALETMGITHLKDKQIYKMSGGEKKMASIATLLSMTPDILLFDEPSIALDPSNRRTLINVLNRLKLTKLIASHDLDLILETCSRVILISEGRIVKDGPAEDILKDKAVLEANHLELPLCMQGYIPYKDAIDKGSKEGAE
ncbi:energy-coupling factor ABC transporter ATP-binding protein [Anaerocolumna chitinilytica]|uniref:Putative ABC transporter ATP-binding protein n=1 Tax=Anaerocolumna chitinilytica TaxID=1727145 RepID=A0A7M3SBA5_9FIRM|nr:putative ABC transporter ATP-binding protein [Anaerocolumna chitinilytica]